MYKYTILYFKQQYFQRKAKIFNIQPNVKGKFCFMIVYIQKTHTRLVQSIELRARQYDYFIDTLNNETEIPQIMSCFRHPPK